MATLHGTIVDAATNEPIDAKVHVLGSQGTFRHPAAALLKRGPGTPFFFADGEFDLIYAGAAVHHTMKYPNALDELLRVLKPGGLLVLAEGYGNNLFLNAARRLRARVSGEPEEAGEGIIFSDGDIETLRRHMSRVDITPLNLFAMTKRLFRGRFESPAVRRAMGLLEALDAAMLRVAPFLKRYCGELVVVAVK